MSTGRFQDAVSALRASALAAPVQAQRTRGRILSDLRRQRTRRAVMLRVVVPLAAVFVGSTAWAAAAGYLPGSWHAVATGLGFDKDAEPAAMTAPPPVASGNVPPHGSPTEIPTEIPAEPAGEPPPLPEPTAPGTQRAAAPVPHGAAAPVQGPAASPHPISGVAQPSPRVAPPPPPATDGDALYAEAHRLHFAERNPAAALSAWDAYLRAAPRGRFAVEAHYNRALCLVRLGRTSQAKGALQPFATGAFGGYRQTEAQALLDAMAGTEH